MKYLFLLIISSLLSVNTFAGDKELLFSYNSTKVEQSFSKVNEIEKIVLQNGTDFNQLFISNKELITAANLTPDNHKLTGSDWELDWGSVAIGAAGCLVLQGIGCLIFYTALANSYPY